jgi:hypothetical protein
MSRVAGDTTTEVDVTLTLPRTGSTMIERRDIQSARDMEDE